MSDSDTAPKKKTTKKVAKIITETEEGLREIDEAAAEAGAPLLVGSATVELVATIPQQDPPFTPQDAVRAFILDVVNAGFDQMTFVVRDDGGSYLVNRDEILND